jgi:hypothetical protein
MAVIGCLAVMMATLTGCDKEDDGRGDSPGGAWTATVNGTTFTLEIDESARTYVMSANGESESGTFDPKTNEMYSDDGESSYTVNYNKSKDTLTLTDNDGIKVVFDRVGGGDNGGGGGGKGDSRFVGAWQDKGKLSEYDAASSYSDYFDASGNYTGPKNIQYMHVYIFRSNGTYREVSVARGNIINGLAEMDGNYSVSGNTINLKNRKEDWTPSDGWPNTEAYKKAYTDKSYPNESISFEIISNSHIKLEGDDYLRMPN